MNLAFHHFQCFLSSQVILFAFVFTVNDVDIAVASFSLLVVIILKSREDEYTSKFTQSFTAVELGPRLPDYQFSTLAQYPNRMGMTWYRKQKRSRIECMTCAEEHQGLAGTDVEQQSRMIKARHRVWILWQGVMIGFKKA